MISVSGLFQLVFGTTSVQPPVESQGVSPTPEPDPEQVFLASIADLTPEEREKRIQRRAFYQQLAERQAMAEVEDLAQRRQWG